jgi:hypothetical protein
MNVSVHLPQADHDLFEPVVHWQVAYRDAHPPEVQLVASIQSGPRQTTAQYRGVTATSLAMVMDARVVLQLYEELGDKIREMGWQQHITGGRPI